MEIKEKIKNVIRLTFSLTVVNDDISQENCEKWDSLRHLNLIVALESEFNIEIEPEEIAEMKTLPVITNIIMNKLK